MCRVLARNHLRVKICRLFDYPGKLKVLVNGFDSTKRTMHTFHVHAIFNAHKNRSEKIELDTNKIEYELKANVDSNSNSN